MFSQLLGDRRRHHALYEQAVDHLHGFRLLRHNARLPILTFFVAEELLVGHADLAIGKSFPLPPGDVLTDGAAFLLRQRGHDGDEQLALAVHRVDVLFLEVYLHAAFLELTDSGQRIHGVPRKPADRFRDDEIDLPRPARPGSCG